MGDIMFNRLKKYINDNDFRINIFEKCVNIVNYIDIIILEDSRISVKYQNGIITILGDNLSVNKMLDKEMLITGNIKSIDFK